MIFNLSAAQRSLPEDHRFAGNPEFEALIATLREENTDLNRLAIADWLEERGETAWARGVRITTDRRFKEIAFNTDSRAEVSFVAYRLVETLNAGYIVYEEYAYRKCEERTAMVQGLAPEWFLGVPRHQIRFALCTYDRRSRPVPTHPVLVVGNKAHVISRSEHPGPWFWHALDERGYRAEGGE